MARFLVTGGCGFIGSHLVDSLVADGHRVTVLDDLSTGTVENLPADVDLIRGDVADPTVVTAVMAQVDGCFHLAAIASVLRTKEDWLGCHRTNLGGTIAVLDAARARRTPVVYASSAAVYGSTDRPKLQEKDPAAPLTPYGADKFGCELHAATASTCFDVPTTGLRFFNVYGPRQDPRSPYAGVISIFADRLTSGHELTIFGDGHQVRDFVYVADVVRHLRAAMDTIDTTPRVFNVATGRETSIKDLATMMAALAGTKPRIRLAPTRVGEIRRSVGDPARAIKGLGVGAKVRMTDGLAETMRHIAPALRLAA